MTSFMLKLIAIITMLIDHVGVVLFPEVLILRIIGRLSFPIFCFLIVQGYLHTKNVKKYLLRLGIFALASEIPFDMAFSKKIFDFTAQNVFFTLFFGLFAIFLYGKFNKDKPLFSISAVVILMAGAFLINCDYSLFGVLLIFLIYLSRNKKIKIALSIILVNFLLFAITIKDFANIRQYLQLFAVLSILPICFYNGKKGKSAKYLFYAFYPVHLLALYLINH